MKKLTEPLVRIAGYLAALGLSGVFALYMSASVGWTFFYILIIAVIFSLIVELMAFSAYRSGKITAEISFSSTLVYKKEQLILHVDIHNKSIVPLANISARLSDETAAICGHAEYLTSASAKSAGSLDIELKPDMWGSLDIGAVDFCVWDFLHIFGFHFKAENTGQKVYVFPDLIEIEKDCPFIRSAADSLRFSDSEDTTETDSFNMFGGMAGYSHKEYEEGDPIKRINWKLSSKKNELYVRLDDEIEASSQTIVIDSGGEERRACERAVEGALAVALAMLRLGLRSNVIFRTENGFEEHEVKDEGGLDELRTQLAFYEFAEPLHTPRLPVSLLAEKQINSNIMLFSPCVDEIIEKEAEEAELYGIFFTAVTSDAPANSSMKIIDDSFLN